MESNRIPQAESNLYGIVLIMQHSTIKSFPLRVNPVGPVPSGHVRTDTSDKTFILLINSGNLLRDSVGLTRVGKQI